MKRFLCVKLFVLVSICFFACSPRAPKPNILNKIDVVCLPSPGFESTDNTEELVSLSDTLNSALEYSLDLKEVVTKACQKEQPGTLIGDIASFEKKYYQQFYNLFPESEYEDFVEATSIAVAFSKQWKESIYSDLKTSNLSSALKVSDEELITICFFWYAYYFTNMYEPIYFSHCLGVIEYKTMWDEVDYYHLFASQVGAMNFLVEEVSTKEFFRDGELVDIPKKMRIGPFEGHINELKDKYNSVNINNRVIENEPFTQLGVIFGSIYAYYDDKYHEFDSPLNGLVLLALGAYMGDVTVHTNLNMGGNALFFEKSFTGIYGIKFDSVGFEGFYKWWVLDRHRMNNP